jgi:DNA polymerase family B
LPSKAQLAIEWPVFQPRGWGVPTKAKPLMRPWYGLDTERDAKTGEFVCGWAVGETTYRFNRLTDLQPGTYWVWNLAYDIEGMLRDLRIPEAWAAKSDGAAFPFLDGVACYYHGKRFDYKSKAGKLNFLEASSFFGRRPLSAIGAKENMDASTMSLARYSTEPAYANAVDSYCIQDARIVYDAMGTVDKSLGLLGVTMGSTPGGTARRFLAKLGPFPKLLWQTHKPFLRSYCGGRFEVTKRGVLHDVKQYDLVSAYPWALSKCPWLTESAWFKQTRRFSPNALYGTYDVGFNYDNYLGVAPRWRGGVRVYSKKEESTWLTRPEVEYLLKRGVDVQIHRGLEVFDENATDLWRQVIYPLFAQKQASKNAFDKGWGPKIVLNSQYGILIQLVRKSGNWVEMGKAVNPVAFAGFLEYEAAPKEFEGGKYYAPLYAGNLTALTRVRLLEAAEEIGPENYIGGHTDSVLSLTELKTGISDELGGWSLEKAAPKAEVCKTGMYAIGGTVKVRGITRKGKASQLWDETHTRKSRVGIKTATSWDDVSVIRPKQVVNNYATEQKRHWFGDVTRGLIAMERYVDSEAWEMVST